MVGMSHDKDKFKPLQEYLDSIPEPKWWQLKTRLIILWSNLIDDITIWKWNRKTKVTKGSVTMDKHFIPTSSYECAKYNHESLDPCLYCEECSVLERTLHKKCKEKELYDYIKQK